MAQKLFGSEDPMGKIVKIDSTANFTVTGVLKPLPTNTQFSFVEYMVPLSYMKEVHWEHNDWGTESVNMFVMLKPGVSRQTAAGLFPECFPRPACEPWCRSFCTTNDRMVAIFRL